MGGVNMDALVLIVDDNLAAQALLIDALERGGVQVITAKNGDAGFESFCKLRPRVVVTDSHMPGMSGWELAKKIKTAFPTTIVIGCSDAPGKITQQQLAEKFLPNASFFPKPVPIEEVLRHLG